MEEPISTVWPQGVTPGKALTPGMVVTAFTPDQKLLGRYRLVRVLGQGGMGVVWLARDEELDRDVALKFLPEMVINDRASLNDLKKETRRSLELTHPNIVRTYDFIQDSTIAGISMEYMDADTLRNLRIDQPSGVFDCARLGPWTRHLCDALDYAHTHASIVHRDLKPANLMVNRKGQLKVTDFGISRSLVESVSQMTLRQGVNGTLVYMSPQQLSGDEASPLDDMYAVGATLYELLTTRPPFYSGDIPGQIHNKVAPLMRDRRASLGITAEEIPENWEMTVKACLAKDPAQRPQSAGEISVRLGLAEMASLTTRATNVASPPPLVTQAKSELAAPTASTGMITTVLPNASGVGVSLPEKMSFLFRERKKLLVSIGTVAVVVAVLIACVAWQAFHRSSDDAKEASKKGKGGTQIAKKVDANSTPTGSLMVKTEPPGAMVQVGDLPAKKSPAVFAAVKAGDVTVRISLDGYEPNTISAQVEKDKVLNLGNVVLERTTGQMQILSTPPGISYELRSRSDPSISAKGTTPGEAKELATGDYEVTLTREGWPPQRQVVSVRRDEPQRVSFEFVGGLVTLNSEPPGAQVEVDGRQLGATPLSLNDVPPGPVKYNVGAAGYDPGTVEGTVVPGKELVLQVQLSKAAGPGVPGVPGEPANPKPVASGGGSSKPRQPSSSQSSRSSTHSNPGSNSGTLGHRIKEGFIHGFGF